MELIRGLHNLLEEHRGCVATIGNFDGVHRGHQQIIKHCQAIAKPLNLPTVAITFEPHAQEYFTEQNAPARLTRLREKIVYLKKYGIDRVLCLPFTEEIAGLSAEDFIRIILVEGLSIKHLIIGDDFRFGRHRSGHFELLQAAGKTYNFGVDRVDPVLFEDERISSSKIRLCLEAGDLDKAEKMLGRPYSMMGRVGHGEKRGREWGIPTANIFLHRRVSPLVGVYAVQVHGIDKQIFNGAAYIGNRPLFDSYKTLLEVHLFQFDKTIYGHYVEVVFLKKIRHDQAFDNIEQLKKQIMTDVDDVRTYFESNA